MQLSKAKDDEKSSIYAREEDQLPEALLTAVGISTVRKRDCLFT